MAKTSRAAQRDVTDGVEVVVDRLAQEVRLLRQAIDEFRVDFTHLLRNLPDDLPPPYQHLTTLAESFAVDCPQRIEHPADLNADAPLPSLLREPRRGTLFD
jgi:hypothetical protein